jgi:hypothetical protein
MLVQADSSQLTVHRLYIIQVLPSFTMLYAQILKRPSLLSAKSDTELLVFTAQVIDHYLCTTPEKKAMSEIIQSMAEAASKAVNGSHAYSGGRNLENTSDASPITPSFGYSHQACTSPASIPENTPPSSDTPLNFYFNVAPDHAEPTNHLHPRLQNIQVERESLPLITDGFTLPPALDPGLWFPSY